MCMHVNFTLESFAIIIMIQDVYNLLQTEREDVPVLLVGGGSILVDCDIPLRGACKVIQPSDHWVRPAT